MLRNGIRRLHFLLFSFIICVSAADIRAQVTTSTANGRGLQEQSVAFEPALELEYEQALKQLRDLHTSSRTLHELSGIADRFRNDHSSRSLGLTLDLFQSLATFDLRREHTAQRINDRILSEAPRDSRVYAEASLVSALQHYAHVPLRRIDVEAGLERLRTVEETGSLSAQTQPELTFWIAEGYRALSVIGQAQEYYDKTIAKSSDPKLNALAAFRRGELREFQGDHAGATQDYLTTINTARSPLILLASVRRASALRSMSDYPTVLRELERADSIRSAAHLSVRTSARELAYSSPLIEELLLERTETDRIVGSTPDKFREDLREDLPSPFILASPLVESEIALLRGSALLESGQYAEATEVLQDGERALSDRGDSLVTLAGQEHIRFISNALQFERAWALYQQRKYEEAATEFLALATSDTSTRRAIQRIAGGNLRDQGRFADPFYEDPQSITVTQLDPSLVYRTTVDTSFFFYNDFPERARFYAGVSLQRAGKLSEAEKVFIALGQDRAVLYSDRARYQRGLLNYAQKNFAQAEILLASVSLDRTVSGAYASYLMGEMTFRRNLFDRAERYMANALSMLPAEDTGLRATAHLIRGMSLVNLNSWEAAAAELGLYATLAPNEPGRTDEALFWLGRAHLRSSYYDSARTALERLITQYPTSPRLADAYYLLGWSMFEQNDYVAAERSFQKVLDIDTISRYAYDVLARIGDANYATNNLERANIILNQAVDRPAFNNYRTTRALYQLGVTRQRLDSSRSALNVFNYLINKFPNSDIIDRAGYNLALSAYAINQNARAEQEVEKIVQQFGSSQFAPRGLALVANERLRSNNLEGSIPYFRRVLERYPTSREAGDALFGMQEALLKLNQYDKAISEGEKFIAANPGHSLIPDIRLNQGRLQLAHPDAQAAQRTFTQFIEQFPTHTQYPFARYYQAKAVLAGGDTARATQLLQATADEFTDNDAAAFSYLELARIDRRRGTIASASRNYTLAYQDKYYSTDAAPQAMSDYAQMLIDAKQQDTAIAVLKEITARYTVQTAAGARAQIRHATLISNTRGTEAKSLLEEVAQARLKDAVGGNAVVTIGELEMNSGNYSSALTQFARAKKDYSLVQETEIRRLFGVGRSQEALGRRGDAAYAMRVLLAMKGVPAADRSRAQETLNRVAPKKKAATKPTAKKTPTKKTPSKAAKKPASKPAKKGGRR